MQEGYDRGRETEKEIHTDGKDTERSKGQIERCIKRMRKTDINMFRYLDMKNQSKKESEKTESFRS